MQLIILDSFETFWSLKYVQFYVDLFERWLANSSLEKASQIKKSRTIFISIIHHCLYNFCVSPAYSIFTFGSSGSLSWLERFICGGIQPFLNGYCSIFLLSCQAVVRLLLDCGSKKFSFFVSIRYI